MWSMWSNDILLQNLAQTSCPWSKNDKFHVWGKHKKLFFWKILKILRLTDFCLYTFAKDIPAHIHIQTTKGFLAVPLRREGQL